jgi:ABC-type amino acid transport substrate-binding protein
MKSFAAALALMAGCIAASAAWAQLPSTLDKVKASGTITLAHRDSSIPLS